MKLECECGFDTDSHTNIENVVKDLHKKSGDQAVWYEDDFENRCPQCGENGLRLIED